MPLVLADYIEDPHSIARRIRDHDHDWMFWLVEAACILAAPGGAEAIRDAEASPPDRACAEILRDRPRLPRLG